MDTDDAENQAADRFRTDRRIGDIRLGQSRSSAGGSNQPRYSGGRACSFLEPSARESGLILKVIFEKRLTGGNPDPALFRRACLAIGRLYVKRVL